MSTKILNPLKGKTSWLFAQNLYLGGGVIRSLKANGGSGNIPKVIIIREKAK